MINVSSNQQFTSIDRQPSPALLPRRNTRFTRFFLHHHRTTPRPHVGKQFPTVALREFVPLSLFKPLAGDQNGKIHRHIHMSPWQAASSHFHRLTNVSTGAKVVSGADAHMAAHAFEKR